MPEFLMDFDRVYLSLALSAAPSPARTAILGRQVWRHGSGPDTWFPVPGQVTFRWEAEIQVLRPGRPSQSVTPAKAAALAAQGDWDVVLEREGNGAFLGSILIERSGQAPAAP